MDGQLLPLARAGILGCDLMVPRFVLDEVQGFADSPTRPVAAAPARAGDARGARATKVRCACSCSTTKCPSYVEVDAKLVALAKRLQLRLLTNDGPLARIAEMQGVPTCNLRRLAYEICARRRPGRLRARRAHARGQGARARASATSTTVRWSS